MDCLFKNKYFEITNWKHIRFEIEIHPDRHTYIWFAPYFICILIKLPIVSWIRKRKINIPYKFGFSWNCEGNILMQFGITLSFIKSKTFYFYILDHIKKEDINVEEKFICYDYKTLKEVYARIILSETKYKVKYLPFIKKSYYGYGIEYLNGCYLNKNSGVYGSLSKFIFLEKHDRYVKWNRIIQSKIYNQIGDHYHGHSVNNKALTIFKLDKLINED